MKDEALITQMKALKENAIAGTDWWDELSHPLKGRVLESLKLLDAGLVVQYEEVCMKVDDLLKGVKF